MTQQGRTIWKFPLSPRALTIEMPRDADILCVNFQYGELFLWAEVVPDRASEKRTFAVFGTGHVIDSSLEKKYVGTVFHENGLVFHVFEVKR